MLLFPVNLTACSSYGRFSDFPYYWFHLDLINSFKLFVFMTFFIAYVICIKVIGLDQILLLIIPLKIIYNWIKSLLVF